MTTVIEKNYTEDKTIIEIGIDEVGRGPLLGRVYVAAVILPKDNPNFDYSNLKDSKKFHSKKKIQEVAEYIKQNAIWTVNFEDENVVDEINILQATQQAMHKCITELIKSQNLDIYKTLLLIDGSYFKSYTIFSQNKRIEQVEHKCIIGGDNKYASIAAASIIAKVARDEYIIELCKSNPEFIKKYGIDTNMGYGTAKHLAGIKQYGITEYHRKSFCKKILLKNAVEC